MDRQHAAVWVVVLAMIGAVGCDSPPRGRSSGRIDTSVTTDAEVVSSKILPVALMEFSDQVPQELAADIADIPMIRDAGQRVTVVTGDLNNKTGNISSTEFELVRSRIRNTLLQSQYVRDKVRFVENRARMQEVRRRELGEYSDDVMPQLDSEVTFALNGDFYHIRRHGRVNQYYMEFQLVHFGSNEIVFSKRYDVKQVRGD